MTDVAAQARAGVPARSARRALVAACAGNVVEWYDFAVFGASVTLLAAALFPGGQGGQVGLVGVFGLFAASFVARPLGAVMVGVRADRVGRRRTFAATVIVMSAATFGIGILPTWSSVGVVATVALVILRLAQGFSSGGEVTTSVTYLAEYAPPGARGRYGGWHLGTLSLGLALGIAAVALVGSLLGPDQLASWGWRVPFLLALPLGVTGLFLRWRTAETPSFVSARGEPPRLGEVLREHRASVLTGTAVVAALGCAFNVWFVYLPSAQAVEGVPLSRALGGAVAGMLAGAVVAPLVGRISDALGRRPVLAAATAATALTWPVAYVWVQAGGVTSLLVANVAVGALLGSFVVPAFTAELFPTTARATGVGIAYGVGSALVGGTSPLLAALFVRNGLSWAVPVYVAAWAALACVVVLRSPGSTRSG